VSGVVEGVEACGAAPEPALPDVARLASASREALALACARDVPPDVLAP
jgi:hypothetical protein